MTTLTLLACAEDSTAPLDQVESMEGWSMKLSPAAVTVKVGHIQKVEAMMVDAAGSHKIVPPALFTSNRVEVVGVVDDEELCYRWYPCGVINVVGSALGEATITAVFERFSASVQVTVVP